MDDLQKAQAEFDRCVAYLDEGIELYGDENGDFDGKDICEMRCDEAAIVLEKEKKKAARRAAKLA